jgi:GNAT superfamily N-acetyltransferase
VNNKKGGFELVPLREAPVLKELDQQTFPVWGDDLTFQQYRAKEQILRETPHCRRAHRTWGLMKDGERVASCETFALPFVYRGLRYVAWTIANIYTAEDHRGKGYATRLFEELVQKAKAERISVLVAYARGKASFFAQFGFIERRNFVARKQVPKTFLQWPAGVVPVDEKSPLNQRSGSDITFIVDEAITFWHRARSHLYARVYDQRYIDVSGARLRGSHILWVPEWRGSFLRLLYRSQAAPEVMSRLMTAALVHGQRYGLEYLEWWCPSDQNEPYAETIVPNEIVPMAISLDPQIPVDSFIPHDSVLCA